MPPFYPCNADVREVARYGRIEVCGKIEAVPVKKAKNSLQSDPKMV